MHGPIVSRLATDKVDEDLRQARERQRMAAHQRQRSLVLASLLFSQRGDTPTHRRSLPYEG